VFTTFTGNLRRSDCDQLFFFTFFELGTFESFREPTAADSFADPLQLKARLSLLVPQSWEGRPSPFFDSVEDIQSFPPSAAEQARRSG
jgi:hypothetical protein